MFCFSASWFDFLKASSSCVEVGLHDADESGIEMSVPTAFPFQQQIATNSPSSQEQLEDGTLFPPLRFRPALHPPALHSVQCAVQASTTFIQCAVQASTTSSFSVKLGEYLNLESFYQFAPHLLSNLL